MKKLLFICILMSQLSFSQQIRPELRKRIEKIVEKMANENLYDGPAVGVGGKKTKQRERFEKMQREATDRELITLTSHINAAVRSYAIEALANRRNSETFEIIKAHLEDNEYISVFRFCSRSRQKVGDFYLNAVSAEEFPITAYQLKEVERSEIDSLVLQNPDIKLSYRSRILEKHGPKFENYRKKENNLDDLQTILNAKKVNDKSVIKEWLLKKHPEDQYIGLRGVKEWPDQYFFPFLRIIHEQEIKKTRGYNQEVIKMLYLSLVQYKDECSRELIEETLKQAEGLTLEYHWTYIWIALTEYPDDIYEGIREKIEPNWKIKEYKKELENSKK
ncbi:MAG: hypothetical protein R2828_34075 [Saprospiraceae bacterium]